MDSKVKQQWVQALRSKEYEQTTNYLRTEKGFCCLGVLCDLYAKEHNDVGWNVAGDVDYEFLDEIRVLPGSVSTWAGLSYHDPYFSDLPMLNDEGSTFEEIAQLIEENF